jgi:hypothetical protein
MRKDVIEKNKESWKGRSMHEAMQTTGRAKGKNN